MKYEPESLIIICSFHANYVQPLGSWQTAGISRGGAQPSSLSGAHRQWGAGSPACWRLLGALPAAAGFPGCSSAAEHGRAGREILSLRRASALASALAKAPAFASASAVAMGQPPARGHLCEAKGVCASLQGRTIPHSALSWLHKGTRHTLRGKGTSTRCFLLGFLVHLPFFIKHPHFQVGAALDGETLSWPCFTGLRHLAFSFSSNFLVLDMNQQATEDSTRTHARTHLPQLPGSGWQCPK